MAIGESTLRDREEKAFRAAARVSKKLGVAVSAFTRDGWLDEYPAPLQALDIMLSEGADPARIYLGHLEHIEGNFPMLLQVAQRGCYMCFDIIGRHIEEWDPIRVAMVSGLVACGLWQPHHPVYGPSGRLDTRAARRFTRSCHQLSGPVRFPS